MAVNGRYDPTLQMFVEEPREPDMTRLGFIRWLVEHGKLKGDVLKDSTKGESSVLTLNGNEVVILAKNILREGGISMGPNLENRRCMRLSNREGSLRTGPER